MFNSKHQGNSHHSSLPIVPSSRASTNCTAVLLNAVGCAGHSGIGRQVKCGAIFDIYFIFILISSYFCIFEKND